MKKTKRIIYLSLIVSLLLCSCNNKDTIKNKQTSNEVTSQQVQTTTQPVDNILPVTTTSKNSKTPLDITDEERKYQFFRDTLSADDVFECTYYTLPTSINNTSYHIYGIYDKENIWLMLEPDISESDFDSIGLYNLKTETFTKTLDIPNIDYLVSCNNDFLIVSYHRDDYNSLCYYDISQNKTFEIFTFDNTTTQMSSHDIQIVNKTIYFDVYSKINNADNFNKSCIYRYDITNHQLEMYKEDAQKPMHINDCIYAITKNQKNDIYEIIESISPENDFRYNFATKAGDIVCYKDKIFIEQPTLDGKKTGSYIQDLMNNSKIIESPTINCGSFYDLNISKNYLYWSMLDQNNQPCLYDIDSDKLIVFDSMKAGFYNTYLTNGLGFITCRFGYGSNNICIFEY